ERSLEEDRVSHDGQFAAENIDFDLAPGVSLDQATLAIERAIAAIGMPTDVQGRLGGTGSVFQSTQEGQPLMILGALLLVYIVLGVLYESYIHPLTILSTLPSAGVGALLAIILTGDQFSLISLLGLFLLIGVVKKNAILMIDLALQFERNDGLAPAGSIRRASVLCCRRPPRPTVAASLGALPLLPAAARGAELRATRGLPVNAGRMLCALRRRRSGPVAYWQLDRWPHSFNRWSGIRSGAALGNP